MNLEEFKDQLRRVLQRSWLIHCMTPELSYAWFAAFANMRKDAAEA